jgi:hypothetical protein
MPASNISTARLQRITAMLQIYVDDKKLAGVNNCRLKGDSLRLNPTHKARVGHHRPIDCGPLDIDRSVMISRELMVAHDTTKLSLAFAIAALGMPAGATALTGVSWIDQRYRYTRLLRLVADKETQLAEGPITVSRSLFWPANPRPRSDTLEIFKDNRPLRAFGFSN